MRIAVGSDHAAFELKGHLKQWLESQGHSVSDCGTDSEESCDYPDYAVAAARLVTGGDADLGVLVCGTGIGMAMTANKVPGIRAANCNEVIMARMARAHNDANVLTIGARIVATAYAEIIVDAFLETPFDGERHRRRLEKIAALES